MTSTPGGFQDNLGFRFPVWLLLFLVSGVLPGFLRVQASFAQTRCFDPPGKTHRWRADGSAVDDIDSADGTLVGDATYGTGRVGQAFQLDGFGDYVEVSNAAAGDLSSGDFSVLFWMNADSLAPGRYIMGKSVPDSGLGWDIRLHNGQLAVVGVGGWATNILTDNFAVAGTWYHVALIGTASAVQLYLDGALVGSTGRNVGSASVPFRIGLTTSYGGTGFAGRIDEVTIFDRALSPFEIASVIAEEAGTLCPGTTTTSTSTTTSTTTTTLPSVCGDQTGDGNVTATDALAVLRCAVGSSVCSTCLADVNGSGTLTPTDALMVLRRAVGQAVVLSCPPC